jgi:phage gp36-like protein
MPYAESSHITAEFADVTFSASTKVSTDDITRFLAEADAEINTRLCNRYAVPITGTESLVLMRMIEIWLVKHRIMGILKVKTPIAKADQGGETDLRTQAIEMLKQLSDGELLLSDAPRATSEEGVKSYSADEEVDHVFQRGEDQW